MYKIYSELTCRTLLLVCERLVGLLAISLVLFFFFFNSFIIIFFYFEANNPENIPFGISTSCIGCSCFHQLNNTCVPIVQRTAL